MKHLFIINPKAGKGKAVTFIKEIKEYFKDKENYFIETTEREGHATSLVREYVDRNDYRVYSIGGDGTLNEVLNGIIGSNSSLAVIPAGTGNDFIKSIMEGGNNKDILRRTIEGTEEFIDLGKINKKYFINISSVGFDAAVTQNARYLKRKPFVSGKLAYLFSIFLTMYKFKGIDVDIIIDGVTIKRKVLLIAIANGKYYGGGMKVAPDAKVTDGLLDICIVNNMSMWRVFRLFPKLIIGRHGDIEEVEFLKCESILIKGKESFPINMDGEILNNNEIHIGVEKQHISVVKPNN